LDAITFFGALPKPNKAGDPAQLFGKNVCWRGDDDENSLVFLILLLWNF
jgi:hypothetical protein